MTAKELISWKRFYQFEPFGTEILDRRTALLCATFAQTMGSKVKQKDFMPKYKTSGRKQTGKDQYNILRALWGAAGARRVTKNGNQ